ncbi:hypothetical protein D3C85_1025590 [compost metagenome]
MWQDHTALFVVLNVPDDTFVILVDSFLAIAGIFTHVARRNIQGRHTVHITSDTNSFLLFDHRPILPCEVAVT